MGLGKGLAESVELFSGVPLGTSQHSILGSIRKPQGPDNGNRILRDLLFL